LDPVPLKSNVNGATPLVGVTVMVPLLSPLHVAFVNVVVKAGVAGVVTSALVVTSQTAALLSVMVNVYVPTVATDTV
jgi:hypothetical protein